MTRFLAFLRSVPGYLWTIIAAIGGIALLFGSARRKGEQVGAAKAVAKVETSHVEGLVHEAEAKATVALEAAQRVEAAGGNGANTPDAVAAVRDAAADARAASSRLRDDLLGRVRK